MTTLTLQKPHLVQGLEQLAAKGNATAEALLDKAGQESGAAPQPPVPPEFLQGKAAFERLKPELLKQYPGRVVAIYQGQVVAVGDDIVSVHDAVINRFGEVLCYVGWVQERLRLARITSIWRVK